MSEKYNMHAQFARHHDDRNQETVNVYQVEITMEHGAGPREMGELKTLHLKGLTEDEYHVFSELYRDAVENAGAAAQLEAIGAGVNCLLHAAAVTEK